MQCLQVCAFVENYSITSYCFFHIIEDNLKHELEALSEPDDGGDDGGYEYALEEEDPDDDTPDEQGLSEHADAQRSKNAHSPYILIFVSIYS